MIREILISVESEEKRAAIIEERNLEEFYIERQKVQRLVGNIYKGVVESIVPAFGAAFVKIGLERNGFLSIHDLTHPDFEKIVDLIEKPYSSLETVEKNGLNQRNTKIKDMLRVGQEILVQIVKEPLGTKGARLTTHITLPGRYLVMMPCDNHRGISRRIQDNKERARLKDAINGLNIPQNMGLIVRTVASAGTKREFVHDLRYLMNVWRKIGISTQRTKAPALIYEEYDLVLRTIRDNFNAQTNRLWVDSKDEYKRIMRFLSIFSPNLRSRVQLYRGDLPLFERRGIEDQIIKIYERKVFLKSGGYLMIEPTESLVAIDVNSGRFTGKKDLEETAYQVNLEAAREIARQIRLRDLGGIIIIDFIDMRQAKNRKKVFDVLAEALKRDHAKTVSASVSEFGLVEMTRQRTRKSLESVAYQHCPYCKGKGMIKSPATMTILALRKIRVILEGKPKKTLIVFAHPNVVLHLLNENRQAISHLEHRYRARILIKQDAALHMEELKIETM